MKTKAHARFFSRAVYLDGDIEMVDVLKVSIHKGLLNTSGKKYLFDEVDSKRHPRLAARQNTTGSRTLVANHLNSTLCEAFIKNIYEDLVQYFSEILSAAVKNGLDPNRLIGEHKVSFEANDILSAGNWQNVVEMVSMSVFRKLENERSTKQLIQKMNTKLNLNVKQTTIEKALPYLEIRHLLVHSEGKADEKFAKSYPEICSKSGIKIKLDTVLLKNTRAMISKLVNEFDQEIIKYNVVSPTEMQP